MSEIKKFLDLTGLTTYDGKIKQVISNESAAGKAADKALRAFLGDPEGYPDNNIPLYADTVNAANTAASDAAEAKAAATEAQDSAANYASSAAASAQDAADILGTPEDDSTKNTVYGVYAKVGEKETEVKSNIDTYVNNTSKPAIDAYVTNNAVPAIDTAKTAAVKDVNDAKTAAKADIQQTTNSALIPVNAAKTAAENAADAAAASAITASNAATTATNAVDGFRAELGERPDENPTVWGSIAELKSATAGGIHFAGIINSENVPELNHDSEYNTIIGTWTDINGEQQSKEFNIGDIIILVNNPDAYPYEPTKEYILTSHLDTASGFAWVELGDVSPADQKITSLENSKLNKSALVSTDDTIANLDVDDTDGYTLVELSADGVAFVRIGAILTSDIDALFT